MDERYMIYNLETQRVELHFPKCDYDRAKGTDLGHRIKTTCLFSREAGCWVSRQLGRSPWRAMQLAKDLGLEDRGDIGERVSFAERQADKTERREQRADRYEGYAENAAERGEQLQKAFNSFRGDWAFATQPNINTSSGRAFTRFRQRLNERYGRGIEEYRKSEYHQHRSANLRSLAKNQELQNPAYLCQRIEENEKALEIVRARMESFTTDGFSSPEEATRWEKSLEDRAIECMEKLEFYRDCLEAVKATGKRVFTRADVAVGDMVYFRGRWDVVWKVGPKNFQVKFPGEHCDWGIPYAYAEIEDLQKGDTHLA